MSASGLSTTGEIGLLENRRVNIVRRRRSAPSLSNHESAKVDFALAQEAARGVRSSVTDLYERYYRMVYSLCYRMMKDERDAEDLSQDVFLKLLNKIGSFRGESQLSTWLYRFTVNQVLMDIRRRTHRRELSLDAIKSDTLMIGADYSSVKNLADCVALDVAVSKLPPGSRSVFFKFDVEGYSHMEIARMFGCSIGNSKSQLHKARKKLRRLLVMRRPAKP